MARITIKVGGKIGRVFQRQFENRVAEFNGVPTVPLVPLLFCPVFSSSRSLSLSLRFFGKSSPVAGG